MGMAAADIIGVGVGREKPNYSAPPPNSGVFFSAPKRRPPVVPRRRRPLSFPSAAWECVLPSAAWRI